MSEWKVCENCDHFYRMHGPAMYGEPWANGPCAAVDCDCPNFYHDPEDF